MKEQKSELHVIFGTGPLGMAVMEAALIKGHRIRMVNRSGKANVPASVECVAADLLGNDSILHAVQGADCVYQCVNPPYDRWPQLFPQMQRIILSAAASVGARVMIGENVYMYGDTKGEPMTEDSPYAAVTRKGSVRARMAEEAIRLHQEGKVRIVIGRGSDFFGPGVLQSSLGERLIGSAVKGKRASLIGNMDMPHSFTYIKDFGSALVELSSRTESFGNCWHVPTAAPRTQREAAEHVFSLLGAKAVYSAMGPFMMRLGGLFIPAAKETVEMMYQFEQPFIVDSSRIERAFGLTATPFAEALQTTVDWYRSRTE
ncbi:MAG: NAD-dependent epimerase/dehydratase family protein [Bacteroidetes bacterium]|nr:NAD-dependent epimerase/dehydratase family protein [Bacteroidota bacterium]